ncbi:MAG: hypothetical protein CVU05_11945 [Bacteroidetes bacterium HGW-Bacteroidetes-21]|nr:MAG: hypothetical protein CVU05_11945 [Bacteroidetes bacterium HGW-Bacteroidetes-21]
MKWVLFILPLLMAKLLSAQDPQFSQFYAVPLYLNPSYCGTTAGTRASINFRDQWPAVPGSFITYSAAIDHYIPSLNSGVGLLYLQDRAGSGHLRSTNIGFQYSYHFRVARKFQIRPGMHFYTSSRNIDFQNLVFNDQVSLSGNSPASIEVPPMKKVSYTDFATSVLVYSDVIYAGFVIDHLMRPNQSLRDAISEVPIKYTFHGGYKFFLNGHTSSYNEESLFAAFQYRSQGKFDQFEFGGYYTKLPLILGLWYRGIPFFKAYNPGYMNNDALIIMAGFQLKDVKVGYSFDLTISRLIANTWGAHEVSLIYEFNQNQKMRVKKKKDIIPCPRI